MTSLDVAIAVLRDWPGTPGRLDRLWRHLRRGHWEYFDFDLDDGPPERIPARLTDAEIDRYMADWARGLLAEDLQRASNAELDLRLAIAERAMVETDDAADVEAIQRELERRQAACDCGSRFDVQRTWIDARTYRWRCRAHR